jgi:cyclomaltodextrinase / maltogenic alpha-amylase / neopullulanase
MDGNQHWASDAIFYHMFPLGCFGAPERNSFRDAPVDRLAGLWNWIDHIEYLGCNALLLGPVFEASAHGYDTADLFKIDRRLGTDETLAKLSSELHRRGMGLVLDAVFHHTGRDCRAFRDIREHGQASQYCDWYYLDFSGRSPYGDPFDYKGWAGNHDLVKLNLRNAAVRAHLLDAVAWWIDRFALDGLRLDVADGLDPDFLRELVAHCKRIKSDFWLMGEVVHGDYRQWAHPGGLDSTTNYEAYKGLWSSHNDRNYFEIAYSLNREFGADGLYHGLPLYNFVDNHDVDRVASILKDGAHLYPLYALLMTMPGAPSIYYGSEFGIAGRKRRGTDAPLRPALDLSALMRESPHPELCSVIKRLTAVRRKHIALKIGDYSQLHVAPEQFAFMRRHGTESIVVAVNASASVAQVPVRLPEGVHRLVDKLNGDETFKVANSRCRLPVNPRWARILVAQ